MMKKKKKRRKRKKKKRKRKKRIDLKRTRVIEYGNVMSCVVVYSLYYI